MNRILLVDDHASLREPLAFMLDREPEFAVVAHAGSLSEARRRLMGVDIAIVDLDLPDGDGTDLIEDLRAANPDVMVLILTASADRGVHALAVEMGAEAVLHKSVRVTDVVEATRRLVDGETLLSTDETIEMLRLANRRRGEDKEAQRAIEQVTNREREVIMALAEGLSDKEIAERFGVGYGTVRNHVASILTKLGVRSRLQALVFAVRHGLARIE